MRYVYTVYTMISTIHVHWAFDIFEDTNMQRKNGTPFLDVHKGIANKTEVSAYLSPGGVSPGSLGRHM